MDGSEGESEAEGRYQELKFHLLQKLLTDLDPAKVHGQGRARETIEEVANQMIISEGIPLPRAVRTRIINDLLDEILGYGPLEPLLNDATISEIMVNAPDEVYIERDGVIVEAETAFRDDAHIMSLVEKIIAPLNKRVDESSPMVDARLPAGYRVNVIIPPLSVKSPAITIRKFFNERVNLDYLVTIGTLTPQVAGFLKACVESRLNLLICGGSGTGKTTMLNALSAFIPEAERVVTIEDPAELQLKRRHVVSLETRPPNVEGKNQVTQRELVINALRMRPDRIIVGEVRGGEAFDMLQAMNTGHDGSICTVHANTPRDALARIESMVLMAGFDLPVRAIREQIASAIHGVVHLSRLRDGKRRISHISEVVGMEEQHITMQDIFLFEQQGVDEDRQVVGELVPTGIRPRFMDKIEQGGLRLDPTTFRKNTGW
ncbi:MAG: CpaF family protein [Chloroflexi bacterium]|nr:CpaF family protein [Chloroflexota bacterium]